MASPGSTLVEANLFAAKVDQATLFRRLYCLEPMTDSISDPTPAQPLTVDQAIANLSDPDTSLRYYAAWWLGRFQVKDPAAVTALLVALKDEDDRTELGGYPLRRNAARALGKLGDQRAVEPLRQCLSCADFYVREAAARSLGSLGDRRVVPDLQALIATGWEAAQSVPGRPHLAQPCEAVLEALGDLGATDAIAAVEVFLDHPLERLRYAAHRAMYQLTRSPDYGERLVEALSGADLQLRRVALSDLGAVGYLPAAPMIAQAAVESSFRLFALKGLLDYALDTEPADSTVPQNIMAWMDSLL